jgi:hypothetical protein
LSGLNGIRHPRSHDQGQKALGISVPLPLLARADEVCIRIPAERALEWVPSSQSEVLGCTGRRAVDWTSRPRMLPSTARAKSCHARGKISSISAHKLDGREYAKSQRRVMEGDGARRIAVSGFETYRRESFQQPPLGYLRSAT